MVLRYLIKLGFKTAHLVECPASLPNFNPIENLRSIIKQQNYGSVPQFSSKDKP